MLVTRPENPLRIHATISIVAKKTIGELGRMKG
jgi:hypothetical protein